jgi:hypothetical protein
MGDGINHALLRCERNCMIAFDSMMQTQKGRYSWLAGKGQLKGGKINVIRL